MTDLQRDGGCFCGAVRYVAAGEPLSQCICHCESCRWATGAPMVPWGTFAASQFRVTRGEVTEYASSPGVLRGHCAACGTSLTYSHELRAGEIDVTLSSFDDAATFTPTAHIWTQDTLPWIKLGDGLPQYATTLEDKSPPTVG